MLKVLQMSATSGLDVKDLIKWIATHSEERCKVRVYRNRSYELHALFWLNEKGKTCFDFVVDHV